MLLTHAEARYDVGDLVGEAASYRLYFCTNADGRQCLLQIATSREHNGGLERAAFILRELKRTADSFEEEYARRGSGKLLSYDRLFPQVVDGFVAEDQGARRVNILAFTEVKGVESMVPLSNVRTRDQRRIVLSSSTWVMGRLLKLLTFTHDQGIAIRMLTGSNILLEPGQHFAVVFDWSSALTYPSEVPTDVRKDDIAAAARAVFLAIGGDPDTGQYPYEAGEEARYVKFLYRLVNRREASAERAHNQFYELIDQLWEQSFRPFQTLPL